MAINDSAPASGEVEYGTVGGAAPGDVVNGGSYNVDPQVTYTDGIGMQRVAHASHYIGTVNYDVTFPVVALLQAMVRGSATNSLTAHTCIAGNVDGEWTWSAAQPASFTLRQAVGEPLTASMEYWGLPAQTATGGAQTAGEGVDVEDQDIGVLVDTVDYYVQSYELSHNNNAYWFDALNSTAATSRAPASVKLGIQETTLTLGCAKQILDATGLMTGADIDRDIAVTITDGSNITCTLAYMCTPVEAGSHQVGALKVYDYTFVASKQLGVLTIT